MTMPSALLLRLAAFVLLSLSGAPVTTVTGLVSAGMLPASERSALVDAFHSLGGRRWRNGTGSGGRWLAGDPCENRWYGVKCDANNSHVVEFFPSVIGSGNDLAGT